MVKGSIIFIANLSYDADFALLLLSLDSVSFYKLNVTLAV